ncbi:protein RADIALIS-like 1 [Cocos nucifera]|nr:protein RADIALIS-like 1 [Cocos nucifera]
MASSVSWTATEDKRFERALAIYDQDTPDRWEKVAAMVGGGKSAADIKRRYDLLIEDIQRIESGDVPFPNYRTTNRYANGF